MGTAIQFTREALYHLQPNVRIQLFNKANPETVDALSSGKKICLPANLRPMQYAPVQLKEAAAEGARFLSISRQKQPAHMAISFSRPMG